MKYSSTDNNFIMRLELGENLVQQLSQFCQTHNITTAFFTGIGSARNIELGFYHLDRKEYEFRNFENDMEIVSLTGNVALVDNKPFLHMHGVFSDSSFQTVGGHIKDAIIGATCEIYLKTFESTIHRELHEEVGLKLLACSQAS